MVEQSSLVFLSYLHHAFVMRMQCFSRGSQHFSINTGINGLFKVPSAKIIHAIALQAARKLVVHIFPNEENVFTKFVIHLHLHLSL
jgi:hypothetical protein